MCAIHQPNFFPRLSTLAKLFTADIWIILDDVQFARRDYQHRCHLASVGDARLGLRRYRGSAHADGGTARRTIHSRTGEPRYARYRRISPPYKSAETCTSRNR